MKQKKHMYAFLGVGIFLVILLIFSLGNIFSRQENENIVKPKDSDSPAAGICDLSKEKTVAIAIVEGAPSPRCVRVVKSQRLRFENKTNTRMQFSFGGFSLNIFPRKSFTIKRPVGEYLENGIHRVSMPYYGGSGPEIWLVDG